jgi:hypothetical protein
MTETDSFPSEPMVCAEATRGVKQHGAKKSMPRVLITRTPRYQPLRKEDGEKRRRYELVHCAATGRQQRWTTPFAIFSDVSPLGQLLEVSCKIESSTFFILIKEEEITTTFSTHGRLKINTLEVQK